MYDLYLLPLIRKFNTQSTKKWLERLQKENVPVLVCLTFADKLYAENMSEDGEHPSKEYMERLIREELSVSYFVLEMGSYIF